MVRAMVGTLLDVGYAKREASSMPLLLAARKRQEAGTSVPAHGLTLEEIHYPPSVFIPFP
jgi:tRNA pseudouridine38-40 synthase